MVFAKLGKPDLPSITASAKVGHVLFKSFEVPLAICHLFKNRYADLRATGMAVADHSPVIMKGFEDCNRPFNFIGRIKQ